MADAGREGAGGSALKGRRSRGRGIAQRAGFEKPAVSTAGTGVLTVLKPRRGGRFTKNSAALSGLGMIWDSADLALKRHPLEGSCQRPTLLPAGSFGFRNGSRCTTSSFNRLRARSLGSLGARIRTSHPSGSRLSGAGDGSSSPWHCLVPPENLRFQVVSKDDGQFSRLLLLGGCQHLRAHDLGASRQRAQNGGRQRPVRLEGLNASVSRKLPVFHLNQPKARSGRNGTWSCKT